MRFALCTASSARDGTAYRQAQAASAAAMRRRTPKPIIGTSVFTLEGKVQDRPGEHSARAVLHDVAEDFLEVLDAVIVVMAIGRDRVGLAVAVLCFVFVCHFLVLARVKSEEIFNTIGNFVARTRRFFQV